MIDHTLSVNRKFDCIHEHDCLDALAKTCAETFSCSECSRYQSMPSDQWFNLMIHDASGCFRLLLTFTGKLEEYIGISPDDFCQKN